MSSCTGRGSCIQQCICTCFIDDIPNEVCICGHRNHTQLIGGTDETDIYCKKECQYNCQVVPCHNYTFCGNKYPQTILDCHNGLCFNCALMIGKIKFLYEKDDCPVCMQNKDMILINCERHKFCLDCWKEWSENSKETPLKCPLCRESIWKRK
jgi:hypothetical protein